MRREVSQMGKMLYYHLVTYWAVYSTRIQFWWYNMIGRLKRIRENLY